MRPLTAVRLETVQLDETYSVSVGILPDSYRPDFDTLWRLHPEQYHQISMHGRTVETPRWQQAYGRSYRYSRQVNHALPTPIEFTPYFELACQVDERFNGLLVNWYDGARGHYIGPHRDSRIDIVADSPFLSLSLGETRTFRFRPLGGKGYVDLSLTDRSLLLVPWHVNESWTHEVPRSKRFKGKRISLTFRAFNGSS